MIFAVAGLEEATSLPWPVWLAGLAILTTPGIIAAWVSIGNRRQLKVNGASDPTKSPPMTGTPGDALARIEQRQIAQDDALRVAVQRDDGRFVRAERGIDTLRDLIDKISTTLSKMDTDLTAVVGWIEQHTHWAESKVDDVYARMENVAERLAALEGEDIAKWERGQ